MATMKLKTYKLAYADGGPSVLDEKGQGSGVIEWWYLGHRLATVAKGRTVTIPAGHTLLHVRRAAMRLARKRQYHLDAKRHKKEGTYMTPQAQYHLDGFSWHVAPCCRDAVLPADCAPLFG